MKRYTLGNKPNFKYREIVKVDISCFGGPSHGIESGIIVGKTTTHVIDTWLVEFSHDFSPAYPFRVVGVPHLTPILSMAKVVGKGKDGKPIYGEWVELPGEFERITTIYRRKYDEYGTPQFSWK